MPSCKINTHLCFTALTFILHDVRAMAELLLSQYEWNGLEKEQPMKCLSMKCFDKRPFSLSVIVCNILHEQKINITCLILQISYWRRSMLFVKQYRVLNGGDWNVVLLNKNKADLFKELYFMSVRSSLHTVHYTRKENFNTATTAPPSCQEED